MSMRALLLDLCVSLIEVKSHRNAPSNCYLFLLSSLSPSSFSMVMGTKSRLGKPSTPDPQLQAILSICLPASGCGGLNMCLQGTCSWALTGVCLSVVES